MALRPRGGGCGVRRLSAGGAGPQGRLAEFHRPGHQSVVTHRAPAEPAHRHRQHGVVPCAGRSVGAGAGAQRGPARAAGAPADPEASPVRPCALPSVWLHERATAEPHSYSKGATSIQATLTS